MRIKNKPTGTKLKILVNKLDPNDVWSDYSVHLTLINISIDLFQSGVTCDFV